MYPRDIRVNNPTEALVVEKALAMVREMNAAANAAEDGKVLGQAESVAMQEGRELTRVTLEAVLNDQADAVEKKGRRVGPASAEERENTEDDASEAS